MTKPEFDKLPLLLRAGDVIAALGVDRHSLENLRKSDPHLAVKVPGLRDLRYRKVRLALLVRMEV